MDFSNLHITITREKGCPHHQHGDMFEFSGRAMCLAGETTLCMTFAQDLARVLPDLVENGALAVEFGCSAVETDCSGQINYRIERIAATSARITDAAAQRNIEAISKLLLNLPMFESFDHKSIRRLLSHFKLHNLNDLEFRSFRKGDTIIRKGEAGRHLHIIIAGSVAVLDSDGITLTTLSRGDVFGEMSLISGNPVGATIKACAPTTILRLNGKDLNAILPRYPSLQSYFSKLLAQRLTRTNKDRVQDLSSGMSGKLSEMPSEELLQALNLGRKTGVLSLQLPDGTAEIYFRNGDIVHAGFLERKGEPAVIEIVKNREGKFAFNPGLPPAADTMPVLGNFMGMLMNALKEMDEKQ